MNRSFSGVHSAGQRLRHINPAPVVSRQKHAPLNPPALARNSTFDGRNADGYAAKIGWMSSDGRIVAHIRGLRSINITLRTGHGDDGGNAVRHSSDIGPIPQTARFSGRS
jgi:hypothetical protein